MAIRDCAKNSLAFSELQAHYSNREQTAQQWRSRGGEVVGQLGSDVPDELIIAAGMLPVRIYADCRKTLTQADKYLEYAFDPVVRAQFEKIADGTYKKLIDYLVISNSTDVLIRVFLYLREILRTEPEVPIPPTAFIDWLFTRNRLYQQRNEQTLTRFKKQLEAWAKRSISDEEIRTAAVICNEDRAAMREMAALRHGEEVRIGGSEALIIIGSAFFMDRAEHARLVRKVTAEARTWPLIRAPRIYMTGSAQESTELYDIVENAGGVVVGEDHDWGDRSYDRETRTDIPPAKAIVDRYMLRQFSAKKAFVFQRVEHLKNEADSKGAEAVLFYTNSYDEAASWEYPSAKHALNQMGIATEAFFKMPYPISDKSMLQEKYCCFYRIFKRRHRVMSNEVRNPDPPRAVKTLEATITAGAYQKDWFLGLRNRVETGGDFGYLNADVPLEVLRTMDIPFVVNQWWAAICGAKRMTSKYFDLLRQAGYRDDLCSYCATAFAESLDPDDKVSGPWGGLPDPTIAITRLTCDCQNKIFELFARNHGADLYVMENTVPREMPPNWWELSSDNWEELYDTDRLDEAEEELKELIRYLETKTGKMFDLNRFIDVMNLINEQETWYKKTRDLIARSMPAPVTVVDTINAVMQAQWHRGTRWAADHAKKLYYEVKALADQNHAAVPNEKYRLMWLGRGLWHDFSFYQGFEQKYGAVFVWSMYLAMGADAYIRNHVEDNPLRALAARYIGMEDFLHCPPWNSQWFLKEAKLNHIDGVVYMVPDNCMQAVEGSYFIKKTLEDNGIPVLIFKADPVDPRKWSRDSMATMIENFIETRVEGVKANGQRTAQRD